jgi:hypothetical protein
MRGTHGSGAPSCRIGGKRSRDQAYRRREVALKGFNEGASRRALEPGKRGPDLVVRVGLTLVKQRWPGERSATGAG